MKTRNAHSNQDQVEITLDDLLSGKYVFAQGCEYTKQLGVKPTGSTADDPKSQINVTYDYSGHGLLELVTEDAYYDHSVKARASIRETNFFPKSLTVKSTNGCKIQVLDLPAEQQVDVMLKDIVDPVQRKAAKAAILATMK